MSVKNNVLMKIVRMIKEIVNIRIQNIVMRIVCGRCLEIWFVNLLVKLVRNVKMTNKIVGYQLNVMKIAK